MSTEYTFSIVTVTFNAEDTIEETIGSIIRQDYKNFEIILVDGLSTDRTVSRAQTVLEESGIFYRILVEKDSGIFDAMNKGVAVSNGKWLLFINSGDELYDRNTLSSLMPRLSGGRGYYYGGVNIRYSNRESFSAYPSARINYSFGMGFCHQGMIISAALLKKQPYSMQYKLAADYCFVLWCESNNITYEYIPLLVATITSGGISDDKRGMVIDEWISCLKKFNRYYYANAIYFFLFRMYIRIVGFAKRVLSPGQYHWLVRLKNLFVR